MSIHRIVMGTQASPSWNIGFASYSGVSFSVSSQEAVPTGLFFKPDGLKMYVVGDAGNDVNEYSLSSDWDISTATYVQNFSVATEDTSPTGLFFKPDGLKMYVVGAVGDDINEYTLSSAWDISTATYSQNFSVATENTSPTGLFFKPDGLKMYVVGGTRFVGVVYLYDLTTPWDISTATYVQGFNVSTQETSPSGIFFKPDGLKMFIIGSSVDEVKEYSLSSAWDISTATYNQNFSVATEETIPTGLFFRPNGRVFYVIGSDTDAIYQYKIG